jgi:hypothetical protein
MRRKKLTLATLNVESRPKSDLDDNKLQVQ